MFRLADRIVVLRHGGGRRARRRVVHPDDVVALITGQQTDSSARRQLSRLHGLADRLASADPSSSLSLILSALGAALGDRRSSASTWSTGRALRLAGALGLPPALMQGVGGAAVRRGRRPGRARRGRARKPVVDDDVRVEPGVGAVAGRSPRKPRRQLLGGAVIGADRRDGVITVFRRVARPAPARRAQPGHALRRLRRRARSSASGLLGEVTARNRVLETIQEVLETLAGPVPLGEGSSSRCRRCAQGLEADEVGLLDPAGAAGAKLEPWPCRRRSGAASRRPVRRACRRRRRAPRRRAATARRAAWPARPDGGCVPRRHASPRPAARARSSPAGRSEVARRRRTRCSRTPPTRCAWRSNAQESERARQEATALRRSQELQRDFLSRLSHELRTPLTAIRGYASSLMQPDVTWDGDSEQRFLSRISAESARLGPAGRRPARLLGDRVRRRCACSADWCDLALVLDAAVACLPPVDATRVDVAARRTCRSIWADHDRLEQVFVNLLDNALRHNPPGTRVGVEATGGRADGDESSSA